MPITRSDANIADLPRCEVSFVPVNAPPPSPRSAPPAEAGAEEGDATAAPPAPPVPVPEATPPPHDTPAAALAPAAVPPSLAGEGEEEADPPLARHFDPAHLAKLRGSGLTNKTINNARLHTETDPDTISGWLGWPCKDGRDRAAKLGPCLVFPHFNWKSERKFVRVRPTVPEVGERGKIRKYVQPTGTPIGPYLPPNLIEDNVHESTGQFLVTEGELKALCATQYGFPCISIPGKDCWGKKREGGARRELLDGIAQMALKGREVVFVLDSDTSGNPQTKRSAYEFQAALVAKGASMKWLVLPRKPDGAKVGLDDFLLDPDHGPDALRGLIANASSAPIPANGELRNYEEYEYTKKDGSVGINRLPRSAEGVLCDLLAGAGGQGSVVSVGRTTLYAVVAGRLRPLADATELIAFAQETFDRGDESRVKWVGEGRGFVTKKEFFAACLNRTKQFDTVTAYPHFPPIERVLYAPFETAGGDGTALAKLIGLFDPASDADEVLLLAAFATPFWGGPPGKRPAFVFAPDDAAPDGGRGTGKTSAAHKIARLAGGSQALNTHQNWADFTDGLVNSASRDPTRLIVWDNVKKDGGWGDLEGFITTPEVGGHKLFKGSCTVPNYYTTIITVNGATFSTDLARRCVPVRFAAPTYGAGWESAVDDFIDRHRAEILGDIAAVLREPPAVIASHGRFPEWETQVLSRFAGADTDAVLDLIRAWQDATDGDSEGADHIREEVNKIAAQIDSALEDHPVTPLGKSVLRWTADAVRQLCWQATGDRCSKKGASAALQKSGVCEFRKERDNKRRWWVWRGADAAPDAKPTHTIDYDTNGFEGWSATAVSSAAEQKRGVTDARPVTGK